MEVSLHNDAPDGPARLAAVMGRLVPVAASADDIAAQTEAWRTAPRSAEVIHRWTSDRRAVFVAALEVGHVAGSVDLEADGHIDHLSWPRNDAMSKVLEPPGAPASPSRPERGAGRPWAGGAPPQCYDESAT